MHYNILFNGCSFTDGSELEGIDNDLEHKKTHRFSHLVAEHYGKTYINMALAGKSNDWIIEQTINWLEDGNTCDLAVIQFTDERRFLLYYDDDDHKKDIRPKQYDVMGPMRQYKNPILQQVLNSSEVNEKRLVANIYFKNIYTRFMGQQQYYKNLFFVNNYFKSKNIPIIFLKMKEEVSKDFGWKLLCKDIKIKNMGGDILPSWSSDKEEKKYYCMDYTHKYNHNKEQRFVHLSGAHPNELGHQKIADYIISEINNANLI